MSLESVQDLGRVLQSLPVANQEAIRRLEVLSRVLLRPPMPVWLSGWLRLVGPVGKASCYTAYQLHTIVLSHSLTCRNMGFTALWLSAVAERSLCALVLLEGLRVPCLVRHWRG